MNFRKCLWILVLVGMLFSSLVQASAVQAAEVVNDKYFPNQTYLKQIKADKAWSLYNSNTDITIAVLDTGVDTDHPDLAANLLPGVNLVKPGKPPEDDNGHGTAVTGILGAVGNNKIGITGVLWNARILPIKVLDSQGKANLSLLAQGIELAIQRGAKIILTSVSSMSYSKELENAVKKAEAKGVIIVAASGNESDRVAYPAAYPTVISVGAVNEKNVPLYESNSGPELNLMAPGLRIYTTARGGGYAPISGTSAAAPQVAGAAALILAKHPQMTPLDVRQLLYQTAVRLSAEEWDKRTGYGLLDVYKALHTKPAVDFHEPNSTQATAKPFPIETELRASLSDANTVGWYYMDVPYNGKVTLTSVVNSTLSTPMAVTFFIEDKQPVTYYMANGDSVSVPSRDGRMYIKVERSFGVNNLTYLLTSSFAISPDRYAPNHNMDTARPLPPGNRISIKGNFSEPGERDWFSYYVRENGKLDVTLSVDTKRIDPVLTIGKQGVGMWPEIDNGTLKDPTERATLEATPGKYYIRAHEYWGNAVNGEYQLDVVFTPVKKDPNEPNDTYQTATRLGNGSLMTGTISSKNDYDWFQFDVDADSYVTIRAPFIPVSSGFTLALYNSETMNYALVQEPDVAQLSNEGKNIVEIRLRPGKYYIRLNSYIPIIYDYYRLTITRERLVSGYRDIETHWARNEIVRLSTKGIVSGFTDYTFRPNASVTRAQFATMLINAMKQSGVNTGTAGSNPFRDINGSHWAYNSMLQAYQLGILQGYPNQLVKPNNPLTRAEMALMIARAKHLLLYERSYSSYRDVAKDNWASPAIEALRSQGWVSGYAGGTFRPQAYATRAEMVVLLTKAYRL